MTYVLVLLVWESAGVHMLKIEGYESPAACSAAAQKYLDERPAGKYAYCLPGPSR